MTHQSEVNLETSTREFTLNIGNPKLLSPHNPIVFLQNSLQATMARCKVRGPFPHLSLEPRCSRSRQKQRAEFAKSLPCVLAPIAESTGRMSTRQIAQKIPWRVVLHHAAALRIPSTFAFRVKYRSRATRSFAGEVHQLPPSVISAAGEGTQPVIFQCITTMRMG